MPDPLLTLFGVEKSFPGVRALYPVDLTIAPGEIVGLVGENGAGKSTLIKILSGVLQPDAGRMVLAGRGVRFAGPAEAMAAGIATIHQELAYFATLPVAENLLLDRRWPRHAWGGVDYRALHAAARKLLDQFALDIPTEGAFWRLSTAQKQEVAIARAMGRESRLLILDEPTASLTATEVARLFQHIRKLRQRGAAVLYTSHRLDEVLELTDRIVVLRDGRLVAYHKTEDVSLPRLVRDMIGRDLQQVYPHDHAQRAGKTRLRLRGASCTGLFHDVSLTLRSGEVVGLAGLVGAGRSEVARAIFGLYPVDRGEMLLDDRPWKPRGPRDALRRGIVYVPEERKRQALVGDHPLDESVSIGFSDLLTRWGIIPQKEESDRVADALGRYRVTASSLKQAVGTLSGGNQQKSVLARWLERAPSVILLDEPTRGIDVAAKAQVHQLIDQLAEQGRAVLLISSDLAEIVQMSDRLYVMRDGTVTQELSAEEKTEENVMLEAARSGAARRS